MLARVKTPSPAVTGGGGCVCLMAGGAVAIWCSVCRSAEIGRTCLLNAPQPIQCDKQHHYCITVLKYDGINHTHHDDTGVAKGGGGARGRPPNLTLLYNHISYLRRRRLCFGSVCLSVCPSDYSQTCERILTKFFGGVGHGSRTN